MARARKVDANQQEIISALRAIGCTVLPLHTVGSGCPDLLVGRCGVNYLLEIKDGKKPPSCRKLTKDQVDFHAMWRGQVAVVTSVNEAFKAVGMSYA